MIRLRYNRQKLSPGRLVLFLFFLILLLLFLSRIKNIGEWLVVFFNQ